MAPNHEISYKPEYTITFETDYPLSVLAHMLGVATDGDGFRLSEGVGYWAGDVNRCVTVTFQGTERVFEALMARIAEIEPDEQLAHVRVLTPGDVQWPYRTMYYALEVHR